MEKPSERFGELASDASIKKAVESLKNNGINAIIANSKEEAKKKVLELIPKGAEVMTMTSQTLEAIGIPKILNESDNYNSVRKKFMSMDRAEQGLEMQKLGAAPEWVVGTQKIVKNDSEAFERIREYTLPLENERAKKAYGMSSNISKMLIVNKEIQQGRITVVFVKENIGF